jgi:hypothetical protein
VGDLFDFLFGTNTTEEDAQEQNDDTDLPEAPDPMPVEVEGFKELVDEINENQTRGEEGGMQIGDHDESDEPDQNEEM